MTLEEAKKILKKEIFGIRFKKFDKPLKFEEMLWIRNEKPEVLEALHIVAKNGIGVSVPETTLRIRSLIIKKMKAGEGEPAPVSGTPLSAAEGMELRWKDNKNTDKNPALEESASQFNDALLDEQAKKIAELTKDKELMKKATLSQLDDFIEIYNLLTKESQKAKRLGKEISKLNGIIHDKNAILSDVAEELRLSKIREKNLTELCQKYIKANEELKEKLAYKVVDKIDAQSLKSAESALAYKEKVIDKLTKENNDYKKCVEEFRNKIADMTIGKIDIQNIRLKEKNKEIKELNDKLKSINKNRHNELAEKDEVIADLGKELAEAKKQNTAVMVDKTAKCFRAARESINDVFESYAAKYAKSTLDELKEKAYNSFNAKAHNLGLVGSKDGNGITDQMEEEKKLSLFRDDSVGAVTNQKDCSPIKDTHPTEDNPEEVEMDEILELVRKALEEGHTVSIDYDKAEEGGDRSATIVECGKDIDDVFEEIKRLCQE